MTMRFKTFPREMLTFFRGLERNNNREWFGPRKEIFERRVRGPMIELVTALNEKMRSVSADHVAEEPARNVYRIYRDTRFSKDKTPYKTHIAATLAHRSLPRHAGAGYYVEVSHQYVGIAGGIYMPGVEELRAVRSAIVAEPKRFLAVVENAKLRRMFGGLQGERLTRLPKDWQSYAESPVADYLKFKQFYWWVELPASVAVSPRLFGTVVRYFEAMTEGIGWFNGVLLADRAEQEKRSRPLRPAPMW
ncbi:MAG TPA: DUF2461 domain-containing protein [Phycisphaerae bacterium]|nr:DUF2461 domain-containing protein [Phycisphaerae bacterium]